MRFKAWKVGAWIAAVNALLLLVNLALKMIASANDWLVWGGWLLLLDVVAVTTIVAVRSTRQGVERLKAKGKWING